jgi:uncharacterized protein YkwD
VTTRSSPRLGESQTRMSNRTLGEPLHTLRSVLPIIVALTVLLPTTATASHRTVAATDKIQAAEAQLLRDINRIRVRNGRKPLRLDKRTRQVARARSSDMATKGYFAHVEPDGDNASRILQRRHIRASEVTENIGHTIGLTLRQGSGRMATWWYTSSPHRRQMLARDVNYVGIGIARRGSRFTYTAIFTRARDRTCPRVVIDEARWRPMGRGARVLVDWHGVDPQLATGTAGVKRFEVERLMLATGWDSVEVDPQRSEWAFPTMDSGYQNVRVRAVDRAGNVGPWSYTRIDIPHRTPRRV